MSRKMIQLHAMIIIAGCLMINGCAGFVHKSKKKSFKQMQNRVKSHGERVWIDGVLPLHWGIGKDVTFFGSLEAALQATDRSYKYSDLMGWSGFAFRTRRFEGDNGQLGSTSDGVGEGPEVFNAIEKATGWRIKNGIGDRITNYTEQLNMETLVPEIVCAVDAGMPVLAYPPHWNMAVIYGYENNGERILLRDYFKGKEEYVLKVSELVPFLLFLEDKGNPSTRKDALLNALRIAVHNWKREPLYTTYNMGHYYYGATGFRKWEEHTKKQIAGADVKGGIGFVHSSLMAFLLNARASAVVFLRENCELLDDDGKDSLKHAAKLYEQETHLISSKEWHKESPIEFCKFLTRAASLETEAIELIGKTLNAEIKK